MVEENVQKPVTRVYTVYVYAVCLVTVLIVLSSAVSFVYALFRIAIPGTTAKGGGAGGILNFLNMLGGGAGDERDQGIVQAIQSLLMTAAAGALFYVHWMWGERLMGHAPRAAARPAAPAKAKAKARKPKAKAT